MRNIFAIILVIGNAAAPAHADRVLGRIDKNTVITDASRDDGYGHGEQIWADTSGLVAPAIHRVGISSKSKIGYKYGSDRSVFIDPDRPAESVFISCRHSKMTKETGCKMDVGFANLTISISPTGSASSACVTMHDFPGRSAAIRVEGYEVINTGEDGCVGARAASTLLKQMQSGAELHVQSIRWPYDYGQITSMNIAGKVELAIDMWRFTNSQRFSVNLFKQDTSAEHATDLVRRKGM